MKGGREGCRLGLEFLFGEEVERSFLAACQDKMGEGGRVEEAYLLLEHPGLGGILSDMPALMSVSIKTLLDTALLTGILKALVDSPSRSRIQRQSPSLCQDL